jgi:hypothetical protein
MEDKKGAEVGTLIPWLIAIVVAVIALGIMMYNKETMLGAIAKLKSLFSFRG